MKYLKTFFVFLFVLACVFTPRPAAAQKDDIEKNFDIQAQVRYSVGQSGLTRVFQNITITNKSEFLYIPSYAITISSNGISNISVSNASGNLTHTETDEDNRKTVTVTFPDKVIGTAKKNSFTFSYDSDSIATKTGNVWRVYIPSVAENNIFSSYSVIVSVPKDFGNPTIIKPYIKTTPGETVYNFSQKDLGESGISMTFGNSQIYNFSLKYNLENKNLVPVKTEIALPPDTAYQVVDILSLSPTPEDVYQDGDGNFLATYIIAPKTKKTITANVAITSFAIPQYEEELQNPSRYLTSQKYWEVHNTEIKKLATTYNTAEKIYDYVVNTLSYSKEKASDNNTRIGAAEALRKSSYAVCLEFTDLFIAMARAAGIPARAVEGYAYTSDENDQPVSLFEDILHSWPQYYDKDQKKWIMVDPTWGNTTHGVDYFNTFDFDHVTFAINGLDSEYPVPAGGYKGAETTKDIEVSFGAVLPEVAASYALSGDFSSFIFSSSPQGKLIVRNTSGRKITKVTAGVYVDGKKNIEVVFENIPPFGKKEVPVTLQKAQNVFSFLSPLHTIEVKDESKTVYEKKITIIPISYWYLIGGGIALGITILCIIALKTWGIPFQRRKQENLVRGESKRS